MDHPTPYVTTTTEGLLPHLVPLSALPNELIADIITMALGHRFPFDKEGRRCFCQLRRVCRLWNDVAFATPELWRGLEVHTITPKKLTHVHRWFRRGGDPQASYTLIIHACKSGPAAQRALTNGLASLMSRYSWRSLGLLELPNGSFAKILPKLNTPNASMRLQHVALTVRQRIAPQVISEQDVESLAQLPSLTNLYLAGFDMTSTFKLHHSSIVSLHLFNCHSSSFTFAAILSEERLPSLVNVIIEDCDCNPPVADPVSTTSDPPLKHNSSVRRLVSIGTESLFVLAFVTFPSLQLLRLVANSDLFGPEVENCLQHFILRSCSMLETLSVEDSDFWGEDIGDILRWITDAQKPSTNLTDSVDGFSKPPSLQNIHVRDCEFFTHIKSPNFLLLDGLRSLVVIEPLIMDHLSLVSVWNYFSVRTYNMTGNGQPQEYSLKLISHLPGRLPTLATRRAAGSLANLRKYYKGVVDVKEMMSLRDYPGLDYGWAGTPYDPNSKLSRLAEWRKRTPGSWDLDANVWTSDESGDGSGETERSGSDT